jgi:hypothetical protein
MLTLMRAFRTWEVGRPLFAVVTPTSIRWTLATLATHLVEERAALESNRGQATDGQEA